MIKKTSDYEIFKFRDDNREGICQKHLAKLIVSIKSRNLLEYQPIIVNSAMEVVNGQHRLLAAKFLDLPIYYEIHKELKGEDILALNFQKSWMSKDYLNYYVKNGNEEYIKLDRFLKTHKIPVKVGMRLTMGNTLKCYNEFRTGQYKFVDENLNQTLEDCTETIDYLRKMNGGATYLQSAKFWRCLVNLFLHNNFDLRRWKINLSKFSHKFCSKSTSTDYDKLFMEVHNYRNENKIDLLNEDK